MRAGMLRRRLAAVIAAAALCVFLAAPPLEQTEAVENGWTDTEFAAGSFTAKTVPTPIGNTCSYTPGVLGLIGVAVTVRWTLPEGSAAYGPANVQAGYLSSGALSQLVDGILANVTTTESGGIFTTKASSLLGVGIFNSNRVLGVRIVDPSGWQSPWIVGTATSQVLGASGGCTFSTATSP